MAVAGELNARQRRHVHMHSTIFDDGGPQGASLHKPGRQEALYEQLKGTLGTANRGAKPEIALPSASDVKCTQLAGHAAVIPSRVAIPVPESPSRRMGEQAKVRPAGEVLVYDGEVHPVLRMGNTDRTSIPKEFWSTSVNLQWHDTRNEKCRDQRHALERQQLTSQELKRQELSSEIFGKARLTEPSTQAPSRDLLDDTTDFLKVDSALHARRANGGSEAEAVAARDRCQQNLASSAHNILPRPDAPPQVPSQPSAEDLEHERRRRQEKNFSDLFGARMGERREVKVREEVLGTQGCSFLDTRAEIAVRNQSHWRSDEIEDAAVRKEAERESQLFDRRTAEKPPADPAVEEVHRNERAIWDSKECMQTVSEVARRRRLKHHLKDFEDPESQTHMSRKQDDLSSQQVRTNLNAPQIPKFAPSDRPMRLGEKHESPKKGPTPAEREQLLRSAKDVKLASLQSSIFS